MPSINSKELTIEIIKNNGHYLDDPQVFSVHQYDNQFGGVTYHLSYNKEHEAALFASPFCDNIIPLWTRGGITNSGQEFIMGDKL